MEDYVEQRDGGYYLAGSRISLDSIVQRFNQGASPEAILKSFPMAGSLERIYGAITFYLANQSAVDGHLEEQRKLWSELSQRESLPDSLAVKLQKAREDAHPR